MKVKKKGFTITELVIVIAVIAILAAVLIPTFSNVIEKANESAASSACSIAVTEYITMVTLDSDPDNNDATGVVFSNDNYYYVYSGGKLHYIGNTEKDSAKLLAVTGFDTDISALTGFTKQSVEEGTAVYEGKMKFTIGGQSVEVDLSDTTRTLYLYNVDIDGTTYAGFFTINNTYGGSGNVIQTVNYSYQSGISQDGITVGQAEVSEEVELVLESISAKYLSDVPIYVGDNKTITPEELKVTASYVGGIEQVLSSNLYTLENATVNTESAGKHTVTVVYTVDTSIRTTFDVTVVAKQIKAFYYYNDLGWANPYAYVWREEHLAVQPAVGDFVLMGNILSDENAWTVDSSIKMFYDSNSNEYVVKGLRITNEQKFKIGKVTSSDSADIWTLNDILTHDSTAWTVQIPAQDAGFTAQLVGDEKDIVLTNSSGDSALYDIYWKNGKSVLYIAKSADQTAENQPNVAINSTYPDEWPGVKMTAVEGNPGLWKVEVDARAKFIVFNDGVENNSQIGINKTADIEIISDTENIYYDDGWHSGYTMYYFYNADGWDQVYANASTTESIALMSTFATTDFGIRMTAVEGKPGWFAVPVASECNTIVFSDGTDVNKTEELTIDNTNVYYNPNNVTAGGNGWSSSFTSTTTYYFYNAAGWEKVYAHYWTESGPGTTWHGVEMTAVEGQDGWFSIDIDDNFKNVVFNDGSGEIEGINKTVNLILSPSTPYCSFENWYSEMPTMVTYYFYNVNNWENVYAYAWADDIKYLGTNRGLSMKALGGEGQEGWYSITVDANATYIKFNSGNLDAVTELALDSETPYYCGENVWKEQMPVDISATLVDGAVFYYGLDFDNSDVVVTLRYANGTSETVTLFTVNGFDSKSAQPQNLTIEYTVGSIVFGTNLEVTIVKEVSGIEVVKNDKVVNVNAVLDASYFTVTAIYQGGYSEEVSEGVTVEADTTKGGTENATVSYGGLSQNVEIEVVKTATSIKVETSLVEVDHNSSVNKEDFTVSVVYDDGTIDILTTDQYTISGDFSTVGLTTLTFEYQVNGEVLTATVEVQVNRVLTSISSQYSGGEVDVGGSLNLDKLTVIKVYSDGSTEQAGSDEYDLSTYDTQAEGTVTVTITYKGTEFTATFDITINDVETYYFYNSEEWGEVYAYAWTDPTVEGEAAAEYLGAFPGTAMKPDTENAGWYYIVVDADAEKIIFNGTTADGKRQQTNNLVLDPETPYYKIDNSTIVLELLPNDNWLEQGARFAVYAFTTVESQKLEGWIDLKPVEENGSESCCYTGDISEFQTSDGVKFMPTTFIVCRMNPESPENSWANKWSQTADLLIDNGLYVKITGWENSEQKFVAKGSATREI